MTEFLNTNSGWLSLIALILSIPIGIAANLATPTFQAWVAQRSQTSIQRRIDLLEKQMRNTDRLVSEPSYATGRLVSSAVAALLGYICLTTLATVLLIILVGLLVMNPVTISEIQGFDLVASFITELPTNIIMFAIPLPICYWLLRPSFHFLNLAKRVTHTEEWKEKTLKELEKLKHQLPQSLKPLKLTQYLIIPWSVRVLMTHKYLVNAR